MDGPRIFKSFAEMRALQGLDPANDNTFTPPDPRLEARKEPPPVAEVTSEVVAKTAQHDAPKPRYGGLHQLAVLDLPETTKAGGDFSQYRIGFNNRGLLGPIVEDLNKRFGTSISYGYSSTLEAFANPSVAGGFGFGAQGSRGFKIGEKAIDELVTPFPSPLDKRAIATFAVAHEFFHCLLRHPETLTHGFSTPAGWRVKSYEKQRRLYEFQSDYLAARYLRLLGLPLEAITQMFRTGNFEENKDYPNGEMRAANVQSAFEDEFRLDLFSNDIVDALDFLESLVVK